MESMDFEQRKLATFTRHLAMRKTVGEGRKWRRKEPRFRSISTGPICLRVCVCGCGKSKIESKSVAPVVDHIATDDGHLVVACVRIVVVRVVVFLAVTMVGKDAADRAAEARPLNKVARNSGRRSCSNHVALLLLLLLPIAGDVVGVKAAREEE